MQTAPRRIYWEVTKRCNLRCVHCRAEPQSHPSPDELSLAEGFRLIDSLRDCGRPVLVLTGGEPLLRQDLFDLARYGGYRGLLMALATNGTLVTTAVARQVVEAGFKRVSISLDGPDAETHDRFRQVPGAFAKAVDGFIRLKELGMSMQVNTTVTQHNRSRLSEMHELVRKLGADAWHLFLFVPVGCGLQIAPAAQLGPSEYESVLIWVDEMDHRGGMDVRAICAPHVQRIRMEGDGGKNLKLASSVQAGRRGCLAGIGMCFISHQGEVFPCGYLPVIAGNVREQPFTTIWETAAVFCELRDPDCLRGKCGLCEYRVVCGGCRARAFGEIGELPR